MVDNLHDMPHTARSMTREEFVNWIATRKEAGAAIKIDAAELKGWWSPVSDPYELSLWTPEGLEPSRNDSPEVIPHFFLRDPETRGWIWQGDLPDDKRAKMQVRIDEQNRRAKEFYAKIKEAANLIDVETCVGCWDTIDESDPYGMELAPYGVINYVLFVRNKGSQDDWIWVNDLPEEKIQSLRERREREKLAE